MSTQPTAPQSFLGRSGSLTGAVAVLWLLLAGPAWWLSGPAGLEGLTIAAALCLVPGWLVFLLAAGYGLPNSQAAVALIGMTLRMAFVLGGTLVVLWTRSELRLREFLVWLLVFYFATLAVETVVLLRGQTPPE